MGCSQSKIDNEEVVLRCKERKLLMKEAVGARNAFAAAHSGYAMCLKNTGAALSDYSHGEVQHPHVPPTAGPALPSVVQSPYETLPPPPPPPPPSLQRAASMPEISVHKPDLKRSDPIIEEENEEEVENESYSLKHRSSRSGGGGGGGSRSGASARVVEDEGLAPPPSPPRPTPQTDRTPPPPPPPSKDGNAWDYFFPSMENVAGPSLAQADEGRSEREEMERKMNEERAKKVEVNDGGHGGGEIRRSVKVEPAEMTEKATEQPPPPPPKVLKKVKQQGASADGKRGSKVSSSRNLLQIFSELDDCFLRASESAHEVSKMLEANRLHYHSNFADNRGHIDHSARVMKVITWNRSFKGIPNADDGMNDFDSEEHETHATVLDKMLAWEKKLYDEVKVGEQMKLEYQRKITSLNKLKKKHGASTESIEKTKAAVSHLHTRYIVDMQSLDSTVMEINRLRDDELYPKLVALVDGMATMWETMRKHHEKQSTIVTTLRFLDASQSSKETSVHHHERTEQLWAVVQEWNRQFDKLITHQKEYIRALNNWLKLNLVPIDNSLKEKVLSPQRTQSPPIEALLHAWHDYLLNLPDELARTATKSFVGVMDSIMQYQLDEMKLRNRCEDTRKELSRKIRQFEDWKNKYMQRRTPPDDMDPDRANDKHLIEEKQLAVEMVQRRLEDEEEAYQKQCTQVRDKSLTTLKTRLPELFHAMYEFSDACSAMYRNLRSIAQPHKPNESS